MGCIKRAIGSVREELEKQGYCLIGTRDKKDGRKKTNYKLAKEEDIVQTMDELRERKRREQSLSQSFKRGANGAVGSKALNSNLVEMIGRDPDAHIPLND